MMYSIRALSSRTGMGWAVVLCLLICLPAWAGQKTDGLYTLRYKFKAGDITSYQTSGQLLIQLPNAKGQKGVPGGQRPPDAGASPMGIPLNSSQKVKVLKALPDGSGALEVTLLSTGMEGGAPTPKTITYTLSPTGVISDVKGVASKTNGDMMSGLENSIISGSVHVYLPEKPVKLGSTWTRKFTLPQSSSTGAVSGTFVSVGQIGRYKTAHLKLVLTIPVHTGGNSGIAPGAKGTSADMPVSGKVVLTFEDDFAIAEGKLIKSAGTGTMDLSVKSQTTGSQPGVSKSAPAAFSAALNLSSSLIQ